jgi:hypothetical protein
VPGYSPDLNPVGDLWSNIKGQELANRCVAGLGEAEASVCKSMQRVRQSRLPYSFLNHAGLFFLAKTVTLICETQQAIAQHS